MRTTIKTAQPLPDNRLLNKKIRLRNGIFFAVALITLCLPITSFSMERGKLGFAPGERLVYDVAWQKFLTAGEGILKVSSKNNLPSDPVYKIEIIGRTVGFIGSIYKAKDHTSAWFDAVNMLSKKVIIKIAENDYRKTKIISFDRTKNIAIYKVNEGSAEEFKVAPRAQGPVSALYIFRAHKDRIKRGEDVSIILFDDRQQYKLAIKNLGKERIHLPIGTIDTIKTVADLKTEGVFRRKGKMTVWFSDDDAFAPVQMATKVIIGSVYSSLREFEGADIKLVPEPKTK